MSNSNTIKIIKSETNLTVMGKGVPLTTFKMVWGPKKREGQLKSPHLDFWQARLLLG